MTQTPDPAPPTPPPAFRQVMAVLRNPRVWATPAVLLTLLALLLPLFYMGGVLNPRGSLHEMRIGLVNSDRGATVGGERQNFGRQIATSIKKAGDQGDKIDWRPFDRAAAQRQLESGKLYGALVIPEGFTATTARLADPRTKNPARPTMTVLTNPSMGSLGSSLAQQASQKAAQQASVELGKSLTSQLRGSGTAISGPLRLVLADPVAVTVQQGHPIGDHSGLGLSALYYTLLLILAGFLGANIISNGVDVALGYVDNEIGPWMVRHPVVVISRTRTLAVKCVMSVVLAAVTSSVIMAATVGILDMDAAHLPMLWVFSFCATAAVGLGVQAINAAFGGIGQLVSMFVFIVMGIPSSGATIPLVAVPPFFRALAIFEPMRQLTDGVRSILYFDARLDAGLGRAWVMTAIGIAVALLFGFAMTRYYDRKGHRRVVPDLARP